MTEKKSSDYQKDIEMSDIRLTLIARKGPTIIELMKGGMTPNRAAEVAEVSRETVRNWLKRGMLEQQRIEQGLDPEPSEKVYMDFAMGALKAESEAQAGLVLAWYKEGRAGDWKAAKEFLAARWRQEWGSENTVKLEVSPLGISAQAAPQKVDIEEDDKRKRAVLAALVEAGDLPSSVLGAWDKNEVIDAEVVENETQD
jgi:hypothetical protein